MSAKKLFVIGPTIRQSGYLPNITYLSFRHIVINLCLHSDPLDHPPLRSIMALSI